LLSAGGFEGTERVDSPLPGGADVGVTQKPRDADFCGVREAIN
jgi:hypothetical protein